MKMAKPSLSLVSGCLRWGLFCLALAGCSMQMQTKIEAPFALADETQDSRKHTEEVLDQIAARNRDVESTREWRMRAYEKFLIRNIEDVEEQEYAGYARYLDNGTVYVVVHPAYYTFFQESDSSYDDRTLIDDKNAVDRLLAESVFSPKTKLIRAQEKMLRDFLEYMSTDRKLLILVLPGEYQHYAGYKYQKASDEYMRFINEVTNESPSVLYLFSRKANRGTLTNHDRKTLMKFLYVVRAKEILVGGGYMGRCLEDFYKEMEQYYEDRIFVVPEITAISPADLTLGEAFDVMHSDGTIDMAKFSRNLKANLFGNQGMTPNIKNLPGIRDPQER